MKFLVSILSIMIVTKTCTKTVTVSSLSSYAAPGNKIVKQKWSGTVSIAYPDSTTTQVTGKSGQSLTLTVTDNKGLTGDTSYIIP